MAIPTTTQILAILSPTPNPYNLTFQYYDYPQQEERRNYPSLEVEKINPGAADRVKKSDITHYTFKVNIFQKILGTDNEEYPNQEQAEQEVITLLEAAGSTLADFRIILEGKNWTRERKLLKHPYYVVSSLVVVLRSIKAPTMTLDGVLVFNKAGSSVDNAPASDYTYLTVYNTLASDGYRDIHEYVSSNPRGDKLPVPFAGGYGGRFVTNVIVQKTDIGTTGDKLNKLNSLRSNGEKPEIFFVYTNKDNESPTPATITESGMLVRIDTVDRLYNSDDNVIYRVIGRFISPPTITAV